MRGCTFKRTLPSGRITWGYSIDAGRDENGRRKRIFESGFSREKDAQSALNRKLAESGEQPLAAPDPRTLRALMEEWFREHAQENCTPKTVERYRQLAAYLLPHLGDVEVRALTALMLQRVLNELRRSGGKRKVRQPDGSKKIEPAPLAPKTVRHIAGLLNTVLTAAITWGIITANPLKGCKLPRTEKREARALDGSETEWLLDAARGSYLFAFLNTAAATGARRGEVLALTWADINLETVPCSVRISKSLEQTRAGLRLKEPKNRRTRVISLPASAVEPLKAHRREQEEFRRQFGPDYRGDLNLVFCSPAGDYLKPDSVTAKVCLLARKVGLKGISLHSLRHSHGSQLLSAGVPLPTVSKRLGHSSVNVTASIYSHALSRDELAAADAWDAYMNRAAEQKHARQ